MIASTVSLAQAAQTVRTGVGYGQLQEWSVIEVSGQDAASYLQAQTTSDVLSLADGQGQMSALLNRKAGTQAYFSLHRVDSQRFWVLAESIQVPKILERLAFYHFAEEVSYQALEEKALIALQGAGLWRFWQALGWSDPPPDKGISALASEESSLIAIRRSLTGDDGVVLVVNKPQAPAVLSQLKAAAVLDCPSSELTPEVLETLRVEAGLPRYGQDMDETVLLPATGLQHQAVSYSKGCYQGQEVVAKVKTYGATQKGLVGLRFESGVMFSTPAVLLVEGKPVGEITSMTDSPTVGAPIALAYLNRDLRVPGKTITFDIAGECYTATVCMLPFYQALTGRDKAKACYEQALAHFAENRESEAITLLREALVLDPRLMDAYEALGVILSRREEYDEAIALMQHLAELDPDAVMPHTNLSVFYMKLGMIEAAENEKALATTLGFKQAMAAKKREQDDVLAREAARRALEDKVSMFAEVLELDPDDSLACYGMGNSLSQLERWEEALPYLTRTLELDPKYTVAYLALGKAYEALQQVEAARSTYEVGIEVAAKRGDLMPLKEMQTRLEAFKTL